MLKGLFLLCMLSAISIVQNQPKSIWKWSEKESSILTCWMRGSPDYDIALARLGKNHNGGAFNGGAINATISIADKEIFEWETHSGGVFAITNDTLVYSDHHPISTGCTIFAVNLKDGKPLWSTKLKGVGPKTHSIYRNRINLIVSGGNVTVYGNESGGQYVEVLDLKTGALISHKLGTKKGQTFQP